MLGETPRPFGHDLPSPVAEHPADAALTPERARRFRQVLARRTRRLAVVVEECYDPHNATAVVRTCDACGVHRVHVVTGRNPFKINRRVSQGSHRYLDLRLHATIEEAYADLHADGYRIFVTDLKEGALAGPAELLSIMDGAPLAVVFGNEGHGLTDAARAGADGAFMLPMAGFAQSLNLSATAAITIYRLREIALATDSPGDLSADEQNRLYDAWVRRKPTVDALARSAADPRALLTTDHKLNPVESFHVDPEQR